MVRRRKVDGFDLPPGHEAEIGDLSDDGEVATREAVAEHVESPRTASAPAHDRTPFVSPVRTEEVGVEGGDGGRTSDSIGRNTSEHPSPSQRRPSSDVSRRITKIGPTVIARLKHPRIERGRTAARMRNGDDKGETVRAHPWAARLRELAMMAFEVDSSGRAIGHAWADLMRLVLADAVEVRCHRGGGLVDL